MKRSSTPAIPTTGPAPQPFAALLMEAIWKERHALIEDDQESYPEFRVGVYALRKACGLSNDQMAGRLGIMPAKFALIEKRGSPVTMTDIERMKALAWEFSLFNMYVYFERQISIQRGKMRKQRPQTADPY